MHVLRLKRRICRLFHWNDLGTAAPAKWITAARALPSTFCRQPLSRKSKSYSKTRWTLALGLRPSGRDGRWRQRTNSKKKSSRLRLPTTTAGCLTTAAAKRLLIVNSSHPNLLPQAATAKSQVSVRFLARGITWSKLGLMVSWKLMASYFCSLNKLRFRNPQEKRTINSVRYKTNLLLAKGLLLNN